MTGTCRSFSKKCRAEFNKLFSELTFNQEQLVDTYLVCLIERLAKDAFNDLLKKGMPLRTPIEVKTSTILRDIAIHFGREKAECFSIQDVQIQIQSSLHNARAHLIEKEKQQIAYGRLIINYKYPVMRMPGTHFTIESVLNIVRRRGFFLFSNTSDHLRAYYRMKHTEQIEDEENE